jgi:hypothetical protein
MPRPDEIIRIADSEFDALTIAYVEDDLLGVRVLLQAGTARYLLPGADAVGLGESLVQVGVMARDGIAPPPGAATERNRGMTS